MSTQPEARCTMVTTSDGYIVEGGYFGSDWLVRSAETRQTICRIPRGQAAGAFEALVIWQREQELLESELNAALGAMHEGQS